MRCVHMSFKLEYMVFMHAYTLDTALAQGQCDVSLAHLMKFCICAIPIFSCIHSKHVLDRLSRPS